MMMQREGHSVYCVTMRNPDGEAVVVQRTLGHLVDGIFCTNRKAKKPFMFERGISIDVWVDDQPEAVNMDFQ